jgi:hypothetical protein
LDADNDGDGVKEGSWLDLHFPIQQTSDGREYAVLHPVTMQKLPGKLNLNTIRHWEVFAELVDNPLILDRTPESDPKNGINPQGLITQDRTLDEHGKIPAVRRDRWLEYLIERDGGFIPGYDPRDTVNAHCKLLIPDSPTAVPFRSPTDPQPASNNPEIMESIKRF